MTQLLDTSCLLRYCTHKKQY